VPFSARCACRVVATHISNRAIRLVDVSFVCLGLWCLWALCFVLLMNDYYVTVSLTL